MTFSRAIRSGIGVTWVVALSLACGTKRAEAPTLPASIAGRVTDVRRSGERIGSIRVEARPGDSAGSDKAQVQVVQGTVILDAGSRRAEFGALRPGQWVRAWFSGPVRESYPVQATAATIVIDSAAP